MKKLEYEPNLVFYRMKDGTYVPKSHYVWWANIACGTEEGKRKCEEDWKKIIDMEKRLKNRGLVVGSLPWKDILARNFLKAGQIEYAAPKVAMLYKCTYEEAVIMCCEALKKLAQSEQILRLEDDPIDCLLKSFKKSYD